MSNPDDEYDVDQSDLQAALGDLLGEGGDGGGDAPSEDLGDDALDLSMLEDAVAELGIDVGDEEPGAPREITVDEAPPTSGGRNPGLDLTELPPPPGEPAKLRDGGGAPMFGGTTPEPPAKKLPPLGQASAADLFGDDEDWDDGADLDLGLDTGPADTPPPPAFEPAEADVPPPPSDDAPAPEPVEIRPDDTPRAAPATDEVIAFAAHKGRLTGEIAVKARKLFGRG